MNSHSHLPAIFQIVARQPELLADLTAEDLLMLEHDSDFWLRPDQFEPPGDWRYWGFLCGRGFGKTFPIVRWINDQVASGKVRNVALLAQDEIQTFDKQAQPLIDASPPWCRAESNGNTIEWENGAIATLYTPESPGKIRGDNLELVWLSEIVAWNPNRRWEAFTNVITATRVGNARVLWDTTSLGRNEIITYLLDQHARDPLNYPITRGTIWDNPMLGQHYLREQYNLYSGRRREEELDGRVFDDTAGAAWKQVWIDANRRAFAPPQHQLRLVSIDPAITERASSDDTGIVCGDQCDGEVYVTRDRTGRHAPEVWAGIALEEHKNGATGAAIETNRGGNLNTAVIRAIAKNSGVDVRTIGKADPWPAHSPAIFYVKEIHARGEKSLRAAGPAALTEAGHVHLIGNMTDLEYEMTTYVPGDGESPNRYDALTMLVTELGGLADNRTTPGAHKRNIANAGVLSNELRSRLRGQNRNIW